jgi:hypothetical protein
MVLFSLTNTAVSIGPQCSYAVYTLYTEVLPSTQTSQRAFLILPKIFPALTVEHTRKPKSLYPKLFRLATHTYSSSANTPAHNHHGTQKHRSTIPPSPNHPLPPPPRLPHHQRNSHLPRHRLPYRPQILPILHAHVLHARHLQSNLHPSLPSQRRAHKARSHMA